AAALQQKTTYPPIVFPIKKLIGNTNLLLSQQAQRGTGIPDLGFSYSPLDFVFGDTIFTNSTILLTNGVAIGTFSPIDDNAGLVLDGTVTFVSEGSPNLMNHIVRFNTVQEQYTTNWGPFIHPSIMTAYLGN